MRFSLYAWMSLEATNRMLASIHPATCPTLTVAFGHGQRKRQRSAIPVSRQAHQFRSKHRHVRRRIARGSASCSRLVPAPGAAGRNPADITIPTQAIEASGGDDEDEAVVRGATSGSTASSTPEATSDAPTTSSSSSSSGNSGPSGEAGSGAPPGDQFADKRGNRHRDIASSAGRHRRHRRR